MESANFKNFVKKKVLLPTCTYPYNFGDATGNKTFLFLPYEYHGPKDAHRTRVGKCDVVIKYSVPIFLSFSQCFVEFMQ